jgi:TldD protein
MEEALRASGADYAEIRIERTESTSLSFRGPEMDDASSSTSLGGTARAFVNGGWGVVTFNDLSDLPGRIREAVVCARLVGKEKSQLAEVDRIEHITPPPVMERDFRGVALSEKREMLRTYNELMLGSNPKIQTTHVGYGDSYREVFFSNSEGSYFEDIRPQISVGMTAVARDGNLIQRGFESVAKPAGFEITQNLQEKAETAAKRAVDLLSAPPVRGGTYTVIANQRFGGLFTHEAFGHLSESDHIYENEKLRDIMVLGKRFGPDHLNIVDDGSMPGQRGTHPVDDEGVPTRKNYLIKDGILVGRLHNRETAAKLGEAVTGNARAISWNFPPIVRMTNTYIEAGTAKFADLIKDIELGLYACDGTGGQTMMEMFTFGAAYGYMIRNGQIAELVRDVVLTGNVFDTLQNIDMVADDITWTPRGGGCGKGGQAWLPVGFSSPHIRIQQVVVGGRND